MATTLGGYKCCDAVTEAGSAILAGQPTEPWLGEANAFGCPLGPGPGRGMVLMKWEDLSRLNREASHDLVIAGIGTSVTLKNLVVGNAYAAVCGARDDPAGTFWVEVFDRRAIAMAGPPLNRSYNVLNADGSDYLSASKNGGSAWTWATLCEDIWTANGLLDAYPGLPFTPDGTPEGLAFWGVPSYDALNQVLDRVGCALKLDPLTDTFSIVRIADADTLASEALERADPVRIWDGYPTEPARLRLPETVRVFFPVVRPAGDTTGASPYYTLDRTDSNPEAGVEAGTVAVLFDDLSAVYDSSSALTNGAALSTRADERASDYFRRLKEDRISRRFSGAMRGMIPGSRIKGVVWCDRGGGVVTDVYRGPGYGSMTPGFTGAEGEAEQSPFPEPGPAGAGPPGAPGGAGRAGANGSTGGRGSRGAPGRTGAAGRTGWIVSLLWPLLQPLVRQTIRLFTGALSFAADTSWSIANGVTWAVAGPGSFKITAPVVYPAGGLTLANGANSVAITNLTRPLMRITGPTAAWSISAITGSPVDGMTFTLTNASGYTGTLTGSSFSLVGGTDVIVPDDGSFTITYDATDSVWRITEEGGTRTSVATGRLIGRNASSGGYPEEITLGSGLSMSGTTLSVSDSVPQWVSVSKTYLDFQAPALNKDIEIYSVPAGYMIHAVVRRVPTTAFSGTGISTITISVGMTPTTYSDLLAAGSVASTGAGASSALTAITGATVSVRARAVMTTGSGKTLNDLAAGGVTFYLLLSKMW